MKRIFKAAAIILIFHTKIFGQSQLPSINVKNANNKIIVSWFNGYQKTISEILIQRSYDSTNNFTTIGSVINPQSIENGFPDANPPYPKMYYRVTIIFEGGSYEIGPSTKPVKPTVILKDFDVQSIPSEDIDSSFVNQNIQINQPPVPTIKIDSTIKLLNTSSMNPISYFEINRKKVIIDSNKIASQKKIIKKENNYPIIIDSINTNANLLAQKKQDIKKPNRTYTIQPDSIQFVSNKKKSEVNYPSNSIYISKYNTLTINLQDSALQLYRIKFFDEKNKELFELKKIKSKCFFIDKMNFPHAGWYYFEIYKNDILIEKNKFNITKDRPKN